MTKESAEQRLFEIQEEIEALQKESEKLERYISKAKIRENTKEILKAVRHMDEDNTMRAKLTKRTRTTPLIDKYYFSDYEFLLFENILHVVTPSYHGWTSVSLVVKKCKDAINARYDGLTMTDLRLFAGEFVDSNYLPEADRKYSMIEEVLLAAGKVTPTKRTIPFMHPVHLGGQTFADQTGFGSEYYGNELVVQGKPYGTVSGFYIIGIFAE